MSATNQFELDLLDLIFTNVDAPNIGDAGGLQKSVADGNFHCSLHTVAQSDTTTDQNVNEAAYTSYGREAIPRNISDWTVSGDGQVDNDNIISFTTATGGSETEVHFGLGFAASAAGYMSIWGALTSSLAVSNGITPEFAAGALVITLD